MMAISKTKASKPGAKLNKAPSIAELAGPGAMATDQKHRESHSVDVREIENGFIVSHHRSSNRGFATKETFTPHKPVVHVFAAGKPPKAPKV